MTPRQKHHVNHQIRESVTVMLLFSFFAFGIFAVAVTLERQLARDAVVNQENVSWK